MKFHIARPLAIMVVSVAVFGILASRPTLAANDGETPTAADQALNEALSQGNRAGVSQLLDAQFQWIDSDGKLLTKSETLDALPALATVTKDEREILAHSYGEVARIAGRNQNTRFVHLWVKHPDGWQAFAFLDTPIPLDGYHQHPVPPRPQDQTCVNPCKVLPFHPANAAERGAMDSWLATKMDEWHAVVSDWPKHVSNSMYIVSNTMFYADGRPERLALLTAQQKAYGTGRHSPAVISMHAYDFGNAVIMTFLHAPNPKGERARAIRLFVKEDSVWKIALSAQTDIQPARGKL